MYTNYFKRKTAKSETKNNATCFIKYNEQILNKANIKIIKLKMLQLH